MIQSIVDPFRIHHTLMVQVKRIDLEYIREIARPEHGAQNALVPFKWRDAAGFAEFIFREERRRQGLVEVELRELGRLDRKSVGRAGDATSFRGGLDHHSDARRRATERTLC